MNIPKIYTVEQAAKQLTMTGKRQVWKAIRDGKIKAINVGTRNRPLYRISESAIQEYWAKLGVQISNPLTK